MYYMYKLQVKTLAAVYLRMLRNLSLKKDEKGANNEEH